MSELSQMSYIKYGKEREVLLCYIVKMVWLQKVCNFTSNVNLVTCFIIIFEAYFSAITWRFFLFCMYTSLSWLYCYWIFKPSAQNYSVVTLVGLKIKARHASVTRLQCTFQVEKYKGQFIWVSRVNFLKRSLSDQ